MDNPNYYSGHYDDEESQNIPYPGCCFSVQEQGHAGFLLYPTSTSSLGLPPSTEGYGASISASPTDPFNAIGVYGEYAPRGTTSLVTETSLYAPSQPVSSYDTNPLNTTSLPRGFSFGQVQDEPGEGTNQGPSLTGWDTHFQSFTPYQEDPHVATPLAMDRNGNVHNQRLVSNKRHKGHATTSGTPFRDLTIDTMAMNTASPRSGSRLHKSARRSKGKGLSAPTTSLSSPTSQSTASSLGSGTGSAALNSFPEDDDSEQDHHPPAVSSSSKQTHNARTRHNMVEQKYRHRLNTHFDKLLEVLPSGTSGGGGGGGGMGDAYQSYNQPGGMLMGEGPSLERERKVSKAEVLDRARLYIQTLENEHVRLQREREELRGLWEGYYERAAMGQGQGPQGGE